MSVVFRFDDDPELKNVRIGLVEASGLSWNGASLFIFSTMLIGSFTSTWKELT